MSDIRVEEGIDGGPRSLVEEIELKPVDSKGALVSGLEYDLPAPRATPFWRLRHDFPTIVVVPILLAGVYLFAIASNRYVSEMNYIVRSGGGTSLSGVASLMQTQGLSRATDENYLVNEYVKSRDLVRLLAERNDLRKILDRPEADFLARFPNFYSRDDFESIYQRFQSVISVSLDETAGITTLRTTAFRAQDAKDLATAVMGYAEGFINKLNDRAHDDELRYAEMIVDKARDKTAQVEAALTLFRNSHGTVNPAQESIASLNLVGRMSEELAKLEAMLSRQIALTPDSPGIGALKERIQSYKDEIAKLKSLAVGSSTSTASALSGYESLVLERELSAKSLEAALLNFDHARQEAQQKHLYIETVGQPNLPDLPEYPKRILDLFLVSIVAIGVWVIQRSLRISAAEHGL